MRARRDCLFLPVPDASDGQGRRAGGAYSKRDPPQGEDPDSSSGKAAIPRGWVPAGRSTRRGVVLCPEWGAAIGPKPVGAWLWHECAIQARGWRGGILICGVEGGAGRACVPVITNSGRIVAIAKILLRKKFTILSLSFPTLLHNFTRPVQRLTAAGAGAASRVTSCRGNRHASFFFTF